MWGPVAIFVAEPAGAGLLAEPSHLDDHIGDRHLAVVRVLRGAALAAVIADVETREIGGRPFGSCCRAAEFDPGRVGLWRRGARLGSGSSSDIIARYILESYFRYTTLTRRAPAHASGIPALRRPTFNVLSRSAQY
jgi:hypothetical protein